MARIISPLGTIKGSIGNLTFSGKAGDNQIRQKISSNSSNTPAQQDTRGRFKLLAGLFRKLSLIVGVGLKQTGNQSPYNRFVGLNFAATSYDMQAGTASLDYTKLAVSGGNVEPLAGVAAVLDAAAGKVTVSFGDNSNGTTALDTDGVKAVVINKLTGRVISQSDEATRGDGTVELEDDALTGAVAANLMAYAFAFRADGSDASVTSLAQVA